MPNLLVVDWDFFFKNPWQGADFTQYDPQHLELYDWTHREAPFFVDTIWSSRASDFLRAGIELPKCDGQYGFWERFKLDPDAVMLYGDSNLHGGRLVPRTFGYTGKKWKHVSLWDAHHDSGYHGTIEEWRCRATLSCEDWMLVHYDKGSQLDVTYPPWRTKVEGIEQGPIVPVKRRIDDGTNPARTYHVVYVCRSGAWVPPWCDDQFQDFLNAFPGFAQEVPGNQWTQPRADVIEAATFIAQGVEALMEQHKKGI